MTETTKTIFEKYEIRKTKKQKADFVDYVRTVAEKHGYTMHAEKGSFGAKNIVIGDPETAKAIFTAHYDTCPRLPFPNFITPKNFFFYIVYQFVLVALMFAVAGVCCWAVSAMGGDSFQQDVSNLWFEYFVVDGTICVISDTFSVTDPNA